MGTLGINGSNHAWEPNTRFFARKKDATYLSKLATFDLQKAEIEGVKNVAAIACGENAADSLDGDYLTIETTVGLRVFWWYSSAGTVPSIVGAKSYHKVTIQATETAEEVARKTALIMEELSDITVSRSGVNLTVTNIAGGVCDGVIDGDTGWVVDNSTPGAGTWSEIGDIKDGAEFTFDDGFVAKNTQKQEEVRSIILNGTAILTNFGEDSYNLIRENFLLQSIDIVLLDDQNEKIGMYYDVKLKSAKPMLLGEEGGLDLAFNTTYQTKKIISSNPPVDIWDAWYT